MQIRLVIVAPQREMLTSRGLIRLFSFIIIEERRIRPYLPSFRRIPAKIIEPATGASTCAFGSHRWSV